MFSGSNSGFYDENSLEAEESDLGVDFENKITTHDWLNFLNTKVDSKQNHKLMNRWGLFTVVGVMIIIAMVMLQVPDPQNTNISIEFIIILVYLAFLCGWCVVRNILLNKQIIRLYMIIDDILHHKLTKPESIRKEYKEVLKYDVI